MIEINGVAKAFGGVKALRNVNLQIKAGEIHALLGENGAGKSTLMKILSGALERDSGTIHIDGEPVHYKTTQGAREKGIGMIYQEFSLVPALTVAENIFLHQLKKKTLINYKQLQQDAAKIIHDIGFNLDVRKPVYQLSVAQQQVVEIAKALTADVKVLILDEPSAVLGPADIVHLFTTLRKLRDRGVALIYISHHLEELFELCNRVTILKDGHSGETFHIADTSRDQLVAAMLGRSLNTMFPDRNHITYPENAVNYQFDNISLFQKTPVNFNLKAGEILGIGGLVGSGRTELLRAIFGADSQPKKNVTAGAEKLTLKNPKISILQGFGMVPEDRKKHGGLLSMSIRENISLANLHQIANKFGFIDAGRERSVVIELVNRLQIKLGSVNDPLSSLSGGNQQKVILAKWLNINANVLLIDEPTRGVDVGARAEIYQIIHELASEGLAIIMVSSDWEELMGLSDRILVMREGQITIDLPRKDFEEETLIRYAIGAHQTNA
jgi:ribose transport system ATP-binding protein